MSVSQSVSVEVREDHVGVVEFNRPPHNFFDASLIRELADAYERLDADPNCRAIVLCSTGKHFCAGANFADENPAATGELYEQAVRLFQFDLPVVAAVQGAAIGGGLGVALSADLRVATPESRFSANFARLGIHHGFGLTVTLPLVVGHQRAIGLCDRLVPAERLREEAIALAAEIAVAAPLALRSIRRTMRGGLPEKIRAATDHEAAEQAKLFGTEDFIEGVAAASERRAPDFRGA